MLLCRYSPAYHERKALGYFLSLTTWKRFCDDIFVAWKPETEKLPSFLDCLNHVEEVEAIIFTIEIADQEKF